MLTFCSIMVSDRRSTTPAIVVQLLGMAPLACDAAQQANRATVLGLHGIMHAIRSLVWSLLHLHGC